MKTRGAEITMGEKTIHIMPSALARSFYSETTIDSADLMGWYKSAPDECSPGFIELLTAQGRYPLFFSAGCAEDFLRLDTRLLLMHAGYEIPAQGTEGSEVSVNAEVAGDTGVAEVPGLAELLVRAGLAQGDSSQPGGDSAQAKDSAQDKSTNQSAESDTTTGTSTTSGAASNTGSNTGTSTAASHEEAREQARAARRAQWSKVATPEVIPEANMNADCAHPFYGQTVCLTGDMEPYDKAEVWAMIANAGGHVAKSVTKKTTILVVGQWESMTTKEKRARELQDKGQNIKIIPFDEFLSMV